MNPAKGEIGKAGEDFAALYLENQGYRIFARNIRQSFGELDIVAIRADGCLVVFEVKTMLPGNLKSEDQMSAAKIKKLKRMSEFFANSHPELVNKAGWEIDVLALTKLEKDFEIKHYKNIS